MHELKLALFLYSSVYWDYAMTIRLEEIVYLHCHQQGKARAGAAGGCYRSGLIGVCLYGDGMLCFSSRAGVRSSGWSLLCNKGNPLNQLLAVVLGWEGLDYRAVLCSFGGLISQAAFLQGPRLAMDLRKNPKEDEESLHARKPVS